MAKASLLAGKQKLRGVAMSTALAGGALLLAACGSSPSNGGNAAVAHLGTTTTTKAPSAQGNNSPSGDSPGPGGNPVGGGAGPVGGPQSGAAMADPDASQSELLAFAHCMQTHGAPSFPEPNAQGVFTGNGVNPGSPGVQTATSKCNHLLPNGGQPTAAEKAQMVAQALKHSQCMRTHGVPDFPDPQISGGGDQISIRLGGKGSDLNPQDPRFQAAQKACLSYTPFAKGGGTKATTHGAAQ